MLLLIHSWKNPPTISASFQKKDTYSLEYQKYPKE